MGFFFIGKCFLEVVDYYSRFYEVVINDSRDSGGCYYVDIF